MWTRGRLVTKVREGKEQAGAKFADYFDFTEAVHHAALAPDPGAVPRREGGGARPRPGARGPAEPARAPGDADYERTIAAAFGIADRGRPADRWLPDAVRWAWRTRILLHLGLDLRVRLRTAAEDEAVGVFAANLRDLLLAAPAGSRATMGLDPGLRTGVKVAVVDATGKVVATDTIYPHEPRRRWDASLATLTRLAAAHAVELVAIGNGTASRETDKLAGELVARHPELKLTKVVVSEAGASVYSASAYASAELPELDVSLRGAVSIARRLQDPLAELVKIDPKSIGVGQYQHDLPESALSRSLDAVVEDCVNAVGVDVNTASAPLLRRVSGITEGLAAHIVAHRDAHGPFRTRTGADRRAPAGPEGVRAVRRLPAHPRRGRPAGLLRRAPGGLPGGAPDPGHGQDRPRHPDRQRPEAAVAAAQGLRRRPVRAADRHRHPRRAGEARPGPAAGVPHRHLRRGRGRDRRPAARACCWRAWSPTWRRSARSSTSGCTRTGWCTSRRCRRTFVKDPREVVKPGDVVRVKVLDVDVPRKRISLTLRLDDEPGGGGRKRGGDESDRGGRPGERRERGGQGAGDRRGGQGSGDRRGGDRRGSTSGAGLGNSAMADALRRAGLTGDGGKDRKR